MVLIIRPSLLMIISFDHNVKIFDERFLQYCISKCCENKNSDIIRIIMALIFRPNVLILVNIFSIIS